MKPIYNPDKEEIIRLYSMGHTQVEIAEKMGFTQKVIWRAMRDYGIKCRVAAKRNQNGELNDYWKGGKTRNEAGYLMIKCKGHPRASLCGDYVPFHVLVMEQSIGRFLIWKGAGHPETEIVHHKNENIHDNRIENLQLTTFSEHMKIHNSTRKDKVMKNA